MGARIRFLKASVADVAGLIQYFSEEGGRAGGRFERSLEAAVSRLQAFPRIGHPLTTGNPRIKGIRSWPVPGFPDVRLYYRPDPGVVSVVRVIHGARDLPGELGGVPHRGEEE